MLEYPCMSFLRFCHNHGLLRISDRPRWRTVLGGGREYVRRAWPSGLPDVRMRTPVSAVRRVGARVASALPRRGRSFRPGGVRLPQRPALRLLADADSQERGVLGSREYQANQIVVHTDESFMPRARRRLVFVELHDGRGEPGQATGKRELRG